MYSVVVNQRQVDVAKQEYVRRNSGVLSRQRIRPHLPGNCPWRKILLQAGRLDLPRNIMSAAQVIHAVLRRALPDGTPRHWALPQLGQVQMIARHVSIHVTLYQAPTVNTAAWSTLTEILFSHRPHLFQFLLTPPHVSDDRRGPLLT